ncbi:hypothetical protein RJT34_04057 [Clitoria ternatea]|uniref:B box-type domain-containing protein n=1 Tax=Clitoria ternatea TaxID=43366 RepID=A0AAN9Q5Q5_CLITE
MDPAWTMRLLVEEFHGVCESHRGLMDNKKRYFCVRCSLSMCKHCQFTNHLSHPVMKIRSSNQEVVVAENELDPFFICSDIKKYGRERDGKVVYVNPKGGRPSSDCSRCKKICSRGDDLQYCSIFCKYMKGTSSGSMQQALGPNVAGGSNSNKQNIFGGCFSFCRK